MKSQRSIKYRQHKADILMKNQQDYQTIRSQRKYCLEEKNNILEKYVSEKKDLFSKQKSQEVSLQRKYKNIKKEIESQAKSRYDSTTEKHARDKGDHERRLKEAAAKEDLIMQRLQ
jgi:uncharacterized membrane protein YccC